MQGLIQFMSVWIADVGVYRKYKAQSVWGRFMEVIMLRSETRGFTMWIINNSGTVQSCIALVRISFAKEVFTVSDKAEVVRKRPGGANHPWNKVWDVGRGSARHLWLFSVSSWSAKFSTWNFLLRGIINTFHILLHKSLSVYSLIFFWNISVMISR